MRNCIRNSVKRILSGILVVAMCFSTSIPVFAALPDVEIMNGTSGGVTI